MRYVGCYTHSLDPDNLKFALYLMKGDSTFNVYKADCMVDFKCEIPNVGFNKMIYKHDVLERVQDIIQLNNEVFCDDHSAFVIELIDNAGKESQEYIARVEVKLTPSNDGFARNLKSFIERKQKTYDDAIASICNADENPDD